MAYADDIARVQAAVYGRYGLPAVWTAALDGTQTPVTVLRGDADTVIGFGQSQALAPDDQIRVRKSELAAPAQGDQVTIDGIVHEVAGDPRSTDPRRTEWSCTVLQRPA